MLYYKEHSEDTNPSGPETKHKVMHRVANRESLPTQAMMGDTCYVTSSGECFVYSGVIWINTDLLPNGFLHNQHRCPYCNTLSSPGETHCKACGAPL